jgi:predicted permease
MNFWSRLRSLVKGIFRRSRMEREMDAELRFHLQAYAEDLMRNGVTREEAARRAQLEFGGVERVKEEGREARGIHFFDTLLHDLRYSSRTLRKNPGFAAIVVLTVALGIAANSTIFSMVSRFVLRPAPVGDPATLLSLHTTHDGEVCCNSFSWPIFSDVRDQARSFSGVAAFYELVPASIAGNGEPQRVWGQSTTANYFDVTELHMAAGRGFTSEEEHLPVVVLSYSLWQSRFGGDPAIAGKGIVLSGRPYTVVGVAPPFFRGLDLILDCQFWVPLGNVNQLAPNTSDLQGRDHHWLEVAGRLKPGVSRAQASAELKLLAQRFAQAHPETDKGGGFRFEQAGSLNPRDGDTVLLFLGALSLVVLLVLAIACANVANLLLARASGRQREMAVRLALGATHGQLMRQLLTESVMLGLSGGVLGVLLSIWATQALSTFHMPAPVPLDLKVSVDWRVLIYTFALSVGTGLLFGVAPAWAASRTILSGALKGEELLARPGSRWSMRNVLVVAQIAMSLVLLCATGLFLRSMQSASSIDIGFRSRGALMMSVDPRLNGYTAERTVQFLNEVRERVAALPGVVSAACTDSVPLNGGNRSDGFDVVGRRPTDGVDNTVDLFMASPGYFETIGTPLIAGRDFANESAMAPKVAVVNEAFVQRFFKNENPLGQHVSDGGVIFEIIGVAKNVKSRTLGENLRPVLYRSLAQSVDSDPSLSGYTVVVQTSGVTTGLEEAVRRDIQALDPTLAVYNPQTMEEHVRDALFLPRLAGTLFGVFGGVGLLLAGIGLYGVMSYAVSRRTREIGIRTALGAQVKGVQRFVIRQGMLLVFIAVALGMAVAFAVAKVFTAFLYGVQPHDVTTFVAVPVFLAGVALLACWIPARRAARVDPMVALRYE